MYFLILYRIIYTIHNIVQCTVDLQNRVLSASTDCKQLRVVI